MKKLRSQTVTQVVSFLVVLISVCLLLAHFVSDSKEDDYSFLSTPSSCSCAMNMTALKVMRTKMAEWIFAQDTHEMGRENMGKVIDVLGLIDNGVEIGVQGGAFAEKVLETSGLKNYYLVDPWEHQKEYDDVANVDQEKQNTFLKETLWRVERFGKRPIIVRNYSTSAAPTFPDNFFDYVYVDARHDYKGVKEDMEAFWPKLKEGGIFAGHDYVEGQTPYGFFGVISAVQEFAKKVGYEVHTTGRVMPTWWWIK
mmetsp:Transcript_11661/g.18969  ORF Transcript_11661/g.18969 Transcript_11661/m.18969 type:complete len:254 (-) Transcript_11661:606-1367(-)|eukprot:CAMPEP_0184644232 /NCGR_PEP_ID=MMETSP0308-20130426/992_1 /TAXON_ID=38269 /ORGANISM="Gloeochaete witrockiana, Strain SAG 46.84" /LENGTH=253 /DNA_ID=CAMNT_0027072659 /DNA_START=53 /DNA_END=814 /DNA_ORIENTATION=+